MDVTIKRKKKPNNVCSNQVFRRTLCVLTRVAMNVVLQTSLPTDIACPNPIGHKS